MTAEREFGAAALHLAGVTALALGWSANAFWRATPAELGAVVKVLTPRGGRALDRAGLKSLEEMIDGR